MRLILLLVSLLLTLIQSQNTWEREATFTIKNPITFHACWQACGTFNGVGINTGSLCKCLKIEKNCSKKCCREFCEETDRLEGSSRDICHFVDNNCVTYRIIREN